MRKSEIKEGELYVVPAPGDGLRREGVKATVLQVGIVRESRRTSSRRVQADGTRVRLEQRFVAVSWRGTDDSREPGYEYEVRTADIREPWDERHEAKLAEDVRIKEHGALVAERLRNLGLTERKPGDRLLRRLGDDDGAVKGFAVIGERVEIDADALMAWLERIEPGTVAAEAINQFVEEVKRDQPWKGLADAEEAELAKWRGAAVREIEEGVAVSDAEIAVG